MERTVTYEIKERLGVLGTSDGGWTKELNIVSWNGGQPKFDIREWDPEHERMSKGVTLFSQEMKNLVDLYVTKGKGKNLEKASDPRNQTK